MYLRKNKVRCGTQRRTYMAIAHNVWWPGENGTKAQSRPVVIAGLGPLDDLDLELARDLVVAVEHGVASLPTSHGSRREAILTAAREVRKIEPFLRLLVGRQLGLAEMLPPRPERTAILTALVRDKLEEAGAGPCPRAPVHRVSHEDVLFRLRGSAFVAES